MEKIKQVEKISLDKPGTLLRCIKHAKLVTPKRSKILLEPGEVVMFISCMFFPETIGITEKNRLFYPDSHLESIWKRPKNITVLNFLHAEQLLRIRFSDPNIQPKEFKNRNLKEVSLFAASFWLYAHFEVAKPTGK